MAWSETTRFKTTWGNKKVVMIIGTLASGDTSGSVVSGLTKIDMVLISYGDVGKSISAMENATTQGQIDIVAENPAATKVVNILAIGH
jgi:hypothetical protein